MSEATRSIQTEQEDDHTPEEIRELAYHVGREGFDTLAEQLEELADQREAEADD